MANSICYLGIILFSFINEAVSGEYCYTYYNYGGLSSQYCEYGCCDDGCCTSDVSAVLWGVLGGIGGLILISVAIAIYCCRRRRAMSGGVVSTAQPWAGQQVTVVSSGGGFVVNNQQPAPAPGVQYPPAPYPQTSQAVQGYPQTLQAVQGYGYPNTSMGPTPPSYSEAVSTPVVHSSGPAHKDEGLTLAAPSAPTF